MPTLTETLLQQIEEYSRERFPARHREHLGISTIGKECWRQIWFNFRWAKLEQHEGRMRRLFNRGHREEDEFKTIMFALGFHNRAINPLTDKPYKASLLDGHYGGTPDDVWIYENNENNRILAEYKTHNNKSFEDLKAKKLKVSKPEHYAQMCGYGKEFQITNGLYWAVNKDNDELYPEFVELDWLYAQELEKKADTIIHSQHAPVRISEQASYWKCKYCNFQGICHYDEPVEKNCRSCKFARPSEKATWYCDHWKGVIPNDWIAKGCNNHKDITK